MRILVFCSTYVPAFRGGTIRAVEAVTYHLAKEHDFFVFARDRHDGAAEPLPGIKAGCWQRTGSATVFYAPPADLAWRRMAEVVSSVTPDAYYVNSFVSPRFGITPVLLRWLGRIPDRPMALAPRGEFHPAARALKRVKKRSFMELARRLPAYGDLLWQAGGQEEAKHIRAVFPDARISIARDLTVLRAAPRRAPREKKAGQLSIVYLSRITPIKNLLGALRVLRRVTGDVRFSVYGSVVEESYFRRCTSAAQMLPPNVRVTFEGEVPHERVLDILSSHDVFFLPTFGESFGHAILEALLAGCVPLISDQTPWKGLSSLRAGWDLPLDDEQLFVEALQSCVDMRGSQLEELSRQATKVGEAAATSQDAVAETIALFERLARS